MRPHKKTNLNPQPRAFSLIELVVVIAITGLLATIALPRFADTQQRYRLRLAGHRLFADFKLAQSHARLAGAQHSITFDSDRNTYQLDDVNSLDNPNEKYIVNLAQSPYTLNLHSVTLDGASSTLNFNGHGEPDRSGELTLAIGDLTLILTIDADSGEITLP